jgi:hypothetical protein
MFKKVLFALGLLFAVSVGAHAGLFDTSLQLAYPASSGFTTQAAVVATSTAPASYAVPSGAMTCRIKNLGSYTAYVYFVSATTATLVSYGISIPAGAGMTTNIPELNLDGYNGTLYVTSGSSATTVNVYGLKR